MHHVDGAALHGLEQLARGHDLVGVEQFDLHLAIGGGVDVIDGRLGHLLTQCGARVGLHAPFDRRLRMDNGWRGQSRRGGNGGPF